jgi:hypothetical protein
MKLSLNSRPVQLNEDIAELKACTAENEAIPNKSKIALSKNGKRS